MAVGGRPEVVEKWAVGRAGAIEVEEVLGAREVGRRGDADHRGGEVARHIDGCCCGAIVLRIRDG